MPRIGGRQKGVGNIPALEKIKANRQRLEKILLDKALSGDVQAIAACLRLLDEQDMAADVSGERNLPLLGS